MSIEIKIRIEFKRNIKISKKIKIYNLFFQFFDLSNVDKKKTIPQKKQQYYWNKESIEELIVDAAHSNFSFF